MRVFRVASQQTGLINDFKLKQSYKKYFGKTVYEFIREQRLEKARCMLEEGECNVTQAAVAVGRRSSFFRQDSGMGTQHLREFLETCAED